jgi:uncharacterized protein (DUF58 family)
MSQGKLSDLELWWSGYCQAWPPCAHLEQSSREFHLIPPRCLLYELLEYLVLIHLFAIMNGTDGGLFCFRERKKTRVRSTSEPGVRLNTHLLPILVGLLLVLQLVVPFRGWLILLVGLGGGWLVSYLWARSLAHGLRLIREMRFGWKQVGDRLEERFTLVNDGWAVGLWVEVVDHTMMPDYITSRVTAVGGKSQIRWHTQRVCTRRGLFTLGPTSLQTGDPLGLYTITLQYPDSATLMVTPPILPLPAIEVAPGGRAGEGRPRANAPERTVSAASVRDYIRGDSLRWIHWRTSARRDSLFVKLFDGTPAGDWWIFLDLDRSVQAGQGQISTEEHSVILAASLADRGLQSGRAVGLVTHGEDLVWLPPQGGDGQRWAILRALALVECGSRPLAALLTRARPRFGERTSLVIITPAADAGWIEALWPLLRRGAIPTVLLLDPASFGGTGEVGGTLALLSDLGVTHYVITSDLLDRPEARPGRGGRWEWRVTPLGRAVPARRPRDLAWKVLS